MHATKAKSTGKGAAGALNGVLQLVAADSIWEYTNNRQSRNIGQDMIKTFKRLGYIPMHKTGPAATPIFPR